MSDEKKAPVSFESIGQSIVAGMKEAGAKFDGTDTVVNDFASEEAFVNTEAALDGISVPATPLIAGETKTDTKTEEVSDVAKLVAEVLGKTQLETEVKPEIVAKPVEAKKPYTIEELRELDYEQIDTSRIPPEGQPIFKSLQRIITKKSQGLSEQKRLIEQETKDRELERLRLDTQRLLTQQEEQRRAEESKRIRAEEELLSPDELEKKRAEERVGFLERKLNMIETQQAQEHKTKAIESEYSAAVATLGLPPETNELGLKIIWAQMALEDANGIPNTPMVQILNQNKEMLLRATNKGPNTQTTRDFLISNPQIVEEIGKQYLANYLKRKQEGPITVPSKQTDIPLTVKKTGKVTFDDIRESILNDPRLRGQ